MKKLLAFLLLITPSAIKADVQSVSQMRGLYNSDASVLIGDNEAQDLLNVDITAGGLGIKKRAGYFQFRTIGVSTHGVRGGYYFRDANSTDTLVNCNDIKCYESVESGAYSAAFISTDTAGSYYDWTDSNGSAWRATNNRDEIASYNGTTLTYYPSLPKGNQIEVLPTRLAISGTSANPNRIHFSETGDFTNFTTGTEDTDPFTEDIGLPGRAVTAIKDACGGLLAFTKDSLSLVTAQTQYDLNPTVSISNRIGTDQPYAVVSNLGNIYWFGQDKNFYSYDCSGITKISSKLDVSGIRGTPESFAWLVTAQSEFDNGSFGASLSSTTSPDDVILTKTITQEIYNNTVGMSSNVAQSFIPASDFILTYGRITCCADDSAAGISTWTIRTDNSGSPSSTILSTATLSISGTFTDRLLSFSPSVSLSANTTYWLHVSSIASTTSNERRMYSNRNNPYSNGQLLRQSDGSWIVTDSGYSSDLTFILSNSSSVYTSETFNLGTGIVSWGTFDGNNTLNNGSITYAIYSDTNSAITISDSATFTSSQTVTLNSVPTLSTAAYVTWTALFNRTASTQTPALNDITVNWHEGTNAKFWGISDKDNRIIWSVADSTSIVPNVSYVYDPRFDSWLKYSFPMEAAAKIGDSLYFGGVSTGVVYRWASGNTDNGSAITAYWKSKDYIGNDPYVEKDFLAYSFLAKTQSGSNLDLTYTINTSSVVTSNFSLTDIDGNSFHRINANVKHGRFGTFINFMFGNDDGDSPFEVYGFKYDYRPRPWRVLP